MLLSLTRQNRRRWLSSHLKWMTAYVFALIFCKLKPVTVRDSYHVPRMIEHFNSLWSVTVFSKMGTNRGYWELELDEKEVDKTAFVMQNFFHRYNHKSPGLKNGPATFQRETDIILVSVKWEHAMVNIDDVVVFSKSPEQHLCHIESILQLVQKAAMKSTLRKCFHFSNKIEYLGHVITPRRLHIAMRTIDAAPNLKYQTKMSEYRSFLGMCNVYYQLVSKFSRVAAPFSRKLKKGKPT